MMVRLSLCFALLSVTLLAVAVPQGYGEDADRPVVSLDISTEGEYFPGYMYWYPTSLFPYQFYQVPEFVVLGEVVALEAPEYPNPGSEVASLIRGPTAAGRIRVDRVLRCPGRLQASASRIRMLVSDAVVGPATGDRVLVFMIPYEGGYCIPRYSGMNCDIGYNLRRWSQADESRLVTLLSSDRGWQADALTPDELRLWAELDPRSVALWAIDALEARESVDGRR